MRARKGLGRLARLMLPTTTALVVGAGAVSAAPAGPAEAGQWALTYLQASKIWPITQGQGVTVAVLDTGVNADNPDLAGQVVGGGDFGNGQSDGGLKDVSPELHGTAMACIIACTGAADGGNGLKGLAPKAKVLSIGMSTGGDNVQAPGEAVLTAVDKGARVINLSNAGIAGDPITDQAIEYAISRGIVVVAGVGNDGQNGNPVEYPAATPGVIAVTEIGSDGNIPAEAEYGPQVVLAAPGSTIAQPRTGGGYITSHGTSNATAYVSAAAALVLAAHPTYNATQVADLLIHTASPHSSVIRDAHYGYGIVNPYAALTTTYIPPPNANPLGADLTATNPDLGGPTSGDRWRPGQVPSIPPPLSASASAQPTSTSSSPAAAPTSNTSGGSSPLVPVLASVGGALVLAGAGAWLIRRRRQRPAPAAAPPWSSSPPGNFGGPPPT